jgi:NADP-dependent 3-hydroxy acid dehydrogenase YdfG
VRSLAALPNHQILLGSRDIHKGEDAAASLGALLNVNPIQLDVNDDASIEHCAKAIEQHFGKLDVLVNNAGMSYS